MLASLLIEYRLPHEKRATREDRALIVSRPLPLRITASTYSASSSEPFFLIAALKMSPSEAPESDEPN